MTKSKPKEQGIETMSQKAEFTSGEGDRMFERYQRAGNFAINPVLNSLRELGVKPKAILEIGCGAGHRLALLQRELGADCHGVEPSQMAVDHARQHYPKLDVRKGTAETIDYSEGAFDVVIFGFCLYLCDPADHFRIAWQADRVLQDKGYMVINDFLAPTPYSNDYAHVPDMRSYKMEWSRMFAWNPAYRLVSRRYAEDNGHLTFDVNEQICVDVLRKDRVIAFPPNPFR